MNEMYFTTAFITATFNVKIMLNVPRINIENRVRVKNIIELGKHCFFLLNVCCVLVFYVRCVVLCVSLCMGLFCHGVLKLDISTVFTTFFL